jgi:hypothetical protein
MPGDDTGLPFPSWLAVLPCVFGISVSLIYYMFTIFNSDANVNFCTTKEDPSCCCDELVTTTWGECSLTGSFHGHAMEGVPPRDQAANAIPLLIIFGTT